MPNEQFDNFDVSVIQTDKLESLAAKTRIILGKLLADPTDYFSALTANSQLIEEDTPLYDLNQIIELGYWTNPEELEQDYNAFREALGSAIIQQWSVSREENPELLPHEQYCGLSCYVPLRASNFAPLNEYYKTHYEWGTASGFAQFITAEQKN